MLSWVGGIFEDWSSCYQTVFLLCEHGRELANPWVIASQVICQLTPMYSYSMNKQITRTSPYIYIAFAFIKNFRWKWWFNYMSLLCIKQRTSVKCQMSAEQLYGENVHIPSDTAAKVSLTLEWSHAGDIWRPWHQSEQCTSPVVPLTHACTWTYAHANKHTLGTFGYMNVRLSVLHLLV